MHERKRFVPAGIYHAALCSHFPKTVDKKIRIVRLVAEYLNTKFLLLINYKT